MNANDYPEEESLRRRPVRPPHELEPLADHAKLLAAGRADDVVEVRLVEVAAGGHGARAAAHDHGRVLVDQGSTARS